MKKANICPNERIAQLDLCPTFAQLPKEEKRSLAEVVELRRAEGGEILFRQGERATGFFVVLNGRVKVHRLSPDGREQVLHMFGGGELVGEVPVFQGGNYPAQATVVEPSELLTIPGDRFLELGEAHPQLLLDLLAILSMRLRKFVGLIDDLSLKEVSARLAKVLIDLSEKNDSPTFRLDSSKAVLASRIGTIAATISRTLAKMQKKKIITVDGPQVTILNPDALDDLAAGEKL